MPERGSRKFKNSRETSLILLLGFVVAAWMKVPAELFWAYVGGLVGASGAFMWGNSKEWSGGKQPPAAPPASG